MCVCIVLSDASKKHVNYYDTRIGISSLIPMQTEVRLYIQDQPYD